MTHRPTLRIQLHAAGMPLPSRANSEDAGWDLTAMSVEALRPRVFRFDTGISVQPPEGYYCEVAPRSSIVKTDFIVANGIGIIDPGYCGHIFVVMRYLGEGDGLDAALTMIGSRVAQLLVRRREDVRLERVDILDASARGEGGFGSSGR